MTLFKQIFRSIIKYKTSSLLTLLSLTISFVGIIILTLYVSFEKSFDKFHENANSVYRVETPVYGSNLPALLNKHFNEHVPEIINSVLICRDWPRVSLIGDESSLNRGNIEMFLSGNEFFDVFTFPLIHGDKETVLTQANTVVLTESMAQKLFNNENVVGKIILLNNEQFRVEGVMKDFPKNSSFRAECIASAETWLLNDKRAINQWSEWSYNIFIQLENDANTNIIGEKIASIPEFEDRTEGMRTRFPDQDFIILTPLSKIHFTAGSNYTTSDPYVINVMLFLILILVVMGAVNFINFATSQASKRIKPLTINQILGGKRMGAMTKIAGESVILSAVAMLVSFVVYLISYQGIQSLFEIQGLHLTGRLYFIPLMVLFAIGFGILAGIYPARYVTSSPIHEAIKGSAKFSGKGKSFRNTLLTIQLIFTIVLIISALFVEKQLHYWQHFNLGIHKEHVVYMRTTSELQKHHQAFANWLMQNNTITDFTYSQFIPGSVHMGWGRELNDKYVNVKCWPVDDNFLDFFDIEIASGRKFNKNSEADINTFILNQKAVAAIGWENPLEHTYPGFGFEGQVVGLVNDFHFSTLKEDIQPMILWRTDSRKYILMLRITPDNISETFAFIKKTAHIFDPAMEVNVQFLDEALNNLYVKETKMARFIELVALWCVLLAATGLLGLIIFVCIDRIKEIGIRKVNGAKISEVIFMLNKDFVIWVIVAFIVSTPVSYFFMNRWLETFAFKTTLSWWIFALAGILTFGLALLTVSWQSWKAAKRNPVEALRYE